GGDESAGGECGGGELETQVHGDSFPRAHVVRGGVSCLAGGSGRIGSHARTVDGRGWPVPWGRRMVTTARARPPVRDRPRGRLSARQRRFGCRGLLRTLEGSALRRIACLSDQPPRSESQWVGSVRRLPWRLLRLPVSSALSHRPSRSVSLAT